jgi:hypothetical protein
MEIVSCITNVKDVEDPDLVEWIAKQTDWYGQRQVCYFILKKHFVEK